MKKLKITLHTLLLATLFCLPSLAAQSQESSNNLPPKYKQPSGSWDRFFVGGGVGLQFGTETLIDLSPHLGYMITDNLAAAVGITYKYYKYRDFNTNIFGGRAFMRYYFLENFFAHAEYEVLNFDAGLFDPYGYYIKSNRVDVISLFVGGGYRQQLGGNSYMYIMALYNLNEGQYTPYQNPVIRIGLDAGF